MCKTLVMFFFYMMSDESYLLKQKIYIFVKNLYNSGMCVYK